MLFFLAGQ